MKKAGAQNEIVIYRAKDGRSELEVNLQGETLWLNLQQIADLFERDKSVVSRHISNIFKQNELSREAVVAKNATTASDGKTYLVEYYNLDAILSVGYRVNSKRGTQFRIWATQVLKDHLLRGYTVNEKRLLEQNARLQELQKTVELMGRLIEGRELQRDQAA